MALETATLQILADILSASHVCLDPAVTRRYVGQVGELICMNLDAVVFPGSTCEVSDVVRAAHAADVPVISRYATANSGAAITLRTAGVALALDRMNQILDLDPAEGIARVQPAVSAAQLHAAYPFGARAHSLKGRADDDVFWFDDAGPSGHQPSGLRVIGVGQERLNGDLTVANDSGVTGRAWPRAQLAESRRRTGRSRCARI